jgi:hypothetical protein
VPTIGLVISFRSLGFASAAAAGAASAGAERCHHGHPGWQGPSVAPR